MKTPTKSDSRKTERQRQRERERKEPHVAPTRQCGRFIWNSFAVCGVLLTVLAVVATALFFAFATNTVEFDVTQYDDPTGMMSRLLDEEPDKGPVEPFFITSGTSAEEITELKSSLRSSVFYKQSYDASHGDSSETVAQVHATSGSRVSQAQVVDVDGDRPLTDYGINYAYLARAVRYWADDYSWAAALERLNSVPHFTTNLGGHKLHFIHITRDVEDAVPLLVLHGWPGSVLEFYGAIARPELRNYHLVIPSLPGFGWSDAPKVPGFDTVTIAQMMVKLMSRLGYRKYFVQGGDWGAMIGSGVAQLAPSRCRGLHLNFYPALPNVRAIVAPWLYGSWYGERPPVQDILAELLDQSGYFHEQATRPDTLSAAMQDHPVALGAWIIEKMHAWSDLNHPISLDDILTNVMIYWTTNTIASSHRTYYEFAGSIRSVASAFGKVHVPVGLLRFPHEVLPPFKDDVVDKFPNLVRFSTAPHGGHFGALEAPDIWAADVATFIDTIVKAGKKPSDGSGTADAPHPGMEL